MKNYIKRNIDYFKFTNTWFNDTAKPQWEKLISQIKPKKILELI